MPVAVGWQTLREAKGLLKSLQTFWQDQCPTALQGWREEIFIHRMVFLVCKIHHNAIKDMQH